MFLFNRKSPEEKEAARLEKLRRTEGDRAFGGAIMTPVSSLSLADICMVRLVRRRCRLTAAAKAFPSPMPPCAV